MKWVVGLCVLAVTIILIAIDLKNAPTDVELWGEEIE